MVEFAILGSLRVSERDQTVELGGGKQRALLTLLLLFRNQVVPADRLIDELWSGAPPATAAKIVQLYVSQLRKVLGDGVLVTRPPGYVLNVEAEALDADRCERLLADGRRLLADGAAELASARLREALALWRGPPLSDFTYEEFAQGEIARLGELRLAVLEERMESDLALGRHADLVGELEALVSEQPLRERLRGQLMLALYRCGRQAEALEAYQDVRRVLVNDLGLEPGQDLQDLEQAILRHDPALAPPARVEPLLETRLAAIVPPSLRRRGPALILAGAVLLGAGIAAAAFELTRGSGAAPAPATGNFVAAIDPGTGRITARIPVGNTPTGIVSGAGAVWVMNADDGTVSRIDPGTKTVVRTFATGGATTSLAVGSSSVWVGNGVPTAGSSMVGEVFTQSLSQIDPASNIVTRTVDLPLGSHEFGSHLLTGSSQIAIADGAVWAINPDSTISRIDERSGRLVATVGGVSAVALAADEEGVWLSDGKQTVARIDARSNTVTARIRLTASGLAGLAVGAGAVWVADPLDGTLWRIDPGPPTVTRTIPVGLDATGVSFGGGAVWVTNAFRGTILRINPDTNEVTRTIEVPGTPHAVAADARAAWVSVDGGYGTSARAAASPAEEGVEALPASACGAIVYGGQGKLDYLIASDLPLQGPSRSSTLPMVRAIQFVLERHRFRAGRFTIGYQSCDDSTAQAGFPDLAKCRSNAERYAADHSVVAVIGTYTSDCAAVEIPIANRASLAMISTHNTAPGLTHPGPGQAPGAPGIYYPTGVRNYARLLASDDRLGAAHALLAQQLGLHAVYVLRSSDDYGLLGTSTFARAARKLGLRVAGVAAWNPQAASFTPLAAKVARSGADGVFLAGFGFPREGELIQALRAQLGRHASILASDGFLPIPHLVQAAGPAAAGMYISYPGRANADLSAAGRRFIRDFGATQPGNVVVSYSAPYAAQATEVLLAAIAASDGTRASVERQLLATRVEGGILGSFRFDANGDIDPAAVTIFRVRGGTRPNSTLLSDFDGSTIDRVIKVPAALAG